MDYAVNMYVYTLDFNYVYDFNNVNVSQLNKCARPNTSINFFFDNLFH